MGKQRSNRRRQQKRKRKSPSRRRPTQARAADRYALYQASVQDPPADVDLVDRVFKGHFGRLPDTLREDFCGTAAMACTSSSVPLRRLTAPTERMVGPRF